MRPAGDQRGIALLVVLLTITLLTIVVVELTYSSQVETHFAFSGRNALQATYLARSGVNIAEAILLRDAQLGPTDSEQDLWARPLPPLPVGDGTVALRVRDEARTLNVNEITSGGGVANPFEVRRRVFERLFDVLGVDRSLLAALVDWLDADDDPWPSPLGAERPYYLGLEPPIEIRNGPFVTVREMLLVRGMTPGILARLTDFVTVLPPARSLKVNVNTAPAEVLYALADGLMAEPGLVDRLIAARTEKPFSSPRDVKDVPGVAEALGNTPEDYLDTKSAYFRIEAVGAVNDVMRGIVTTVRRDTGVLGRVRRLTWAPSTATLSLTSQPPSDFLATLPPLGGG
jgi:general secretion pathway protein K